MKYTAPDGKGGNVTLFEKRVSAHWRLRKRAYATLFRPVGRGCYFDEHQLWNSRTEAGPEFPDWEWAEVDGGRLVWAQGGKLFSGRVGPRGLGSVKELYDFNLYVSKSLVRLTEDYAPPAVATDPLRRAPPACARR
jgi:hypothetical protein